MQSGSTNIFCDSLKFRVCEKLEMGLGAEKQTLACISKSSCHKADG